MLTQLKLSNFKIFDDSVTVRFRPITILIGKNNAGKSSVIDFLSILRRSLSMESKSFLDVEDLHRFKNEKTDKISLEFSLKTKEDCSPGDALAGYLDQSSLHSEINHQISASVRYSRKPGFRGKSEMRTLIEGEDILSLSMPVTDNDRFLDFGKARQKQVNESKNDGSRIIAEDYCLRSLAQQISAVYHVSAAREHIPDTVNLRQAIGTDYVGKAGENTLPLLHKIFRSERYEFMLPHLKNVLGISEIAFDEKGDLAQCIATNKKTGAEVNVSDFGFGVSQCLPIFVQGVLMNRYNTLMVERPEAQVHPTAQLELGSFFADLWTEKKVCSIIETHSGNVILKLRRLIARGDYPLNPDDVSIVLFDVKNGKAVIENLDVDEDGGLPGLPAIFFGAHIAEALEMGAEKYKRQARAA